MPDYIGLEFIKPNYDEDLYTETARWCNESQRARIVERGDRYVVEALPAPSLKDRREAKLLYLRISFRERVAGTITTSQGFTMQFDTSDSIKMQGAITLLETTGEMEGYLTQANDETVYHVPLATMNAVLVEMLAAYAACHARKQELRAAINAAQTEEELDAIKITWPV